MTGKATKTELLEIQQVLFQELQQSNFNNEVLSERMADLELALEDSNWMRMMMEGQQEFSRDGLRRIVELARVMYIKNPIIKRGVMVRALYIWAQGISVKYKNPDLNKVLQDFWDDPKNRVELTSHQAQMLKQVDIEVESNLFFVFFVRPTDGRVRVRTLPFDEVSEIISDPQDSKTPWYYVRQWSETSIDAMGRRTTRTHKACYPDWNYKPVTKLPKISGMAVRWDTPVFHVKTGGMSNWKFGVSRIYAAIDWARAYKEFLEDVASLMRAYSRFAWKRVTKGGKKAIAAEKARMASTLAASGGSGETNPAPVTGAMAILGEGTDLQPMQLRGAAISAEDGRRFLLMAAAGLDLPETYFGDVSVGTFATAKTMDRPTELGMKEGQTFWTDVLGQIFDFMILQAMTSTSSPIKSLGHVDVTVDDGCKEEKIVWNTGVNTMRDIDFPPILEKDIQTAVQAVITALTLNGQDLRLLDDQLATRLILKAMGEDDIDEIMTELFPDGETMPAGKGQPAATPSEARVQEAARKLVLAIIEAKKNGTLDKLLNEAEDA
jgi:hypothetical protein